MLGGSVYPLNMEFPLYVKDYRARSKLGKQGLVEGSVYKDESPKKYLNSFPVFLTHQTYLTLVDFLKIYIFIYLAVSGFICGVWAPECTGSVVVACRLSCPKICGILVP